MYLYLLAHHDQILTIIIFSDLLWENEFYLFKLWYFVCIINLVLLKQTFICKRSIWKYSYTSQIAIRAKEKKQYLQFDMYDVCCVHILIYWLDFIIRYTCHQRMTNSSKLFKTQTKSSFYSIETIGS